MHRFILFLAALALPLSALNALSEPIKVSPRLPKLSHIVVYSSEKFYSAFPSIIRQPRGELIVAFRRAPERRVFGEKSVSHTDPNAYLVLVRSVDGGLTWSPEPDLIYAHPLGGSQDPCLVQLHDQSIICTSYAWAWVHSDALAKISQAQHHGNFAFLGGFLLRSTDRGQSWKGPILPPSCPGEVTRDIYGEPIPAYNRGALCEGRDGKLYWAIAANRSPGSARTETHLLISTDKGRHWQYSCPIAQDQKISFNETSLYQTPKGDLVAFMRTENANDRTITARSTDGGKSFGPWTDPGFRGHPHHAIGLPDKRVLLVYGYRHAPYGIRARLLDPECTRFDTEEIVLRADGGNGDLGYPWATLVSKTRALVVYYFNQQDGTRHIAGTFLDF